MLLSGFAYENKKYKFCFLLILKLIRNLFVFIESTDLLKCKLLVLIDQSKGFIYLFILMEKLNHD